MFEFEKNQQGLAIMTEVIARRRDHIADRDLAEIHTSFEILRRQAATLPSPLFETLKDAIFLLAMEWTDRPHNHGHITRDRDPGPIRRDFVTMGAQGYRAPDPVSDADGPTDAERELSAGIDAVQRMTDKWKFCARPGDLADAITLLYDWAVNAAGTLPDYMQDADYQCTACDRLELDCSIDPCQDVIVDRESDDWDWISVRDRFATLSDCLDIPPADAGELAAELHSIANWINPAPR